MPERDADAPSAAHPPSAGGLPGYARLLLALSRLRLTPQQVTEVRELASRQDLDWGAFLDAAARHKVLPLVGRHVHRYRLDRREESTDGFPYPWLFASAYLGNRQRNQALSDEFGRLFDDLAAAGIRYAVRKGFALAEHLHHDPAARRINDLDLLLDRADAARADDLLKRHGYSQGQLAADGDRIEPFSQATHMFWRMKLSNQLPYRKPGNRQDIPDFNVDLCHSIFQRNADIDAPVGDLLSRAVPAVICGADSWMLDPEDCLLDLCSHLYKEATSTTFIREGMDLQLSKFLDVALLAESFGPDTWQAFAARVERSRASAIAYYTLHFTALLHPEAVPAGILARLRPADIGYLEQFGALEGTTAEWSQDFIGRLFDTGRSSSGGAAGHTGPGQAVLSASYHA
ncbi:nucleotidyltransferase family protein [Streptomyces polygonati]|uniref:Nucleotidyltransferase family protein n=1 Tax=Streptomyces polygonati TaxID=1617087 RepID=A0ABV8HTH1_9ACTN